MRRDQLNDLAAFMVVADERSFTRAAAKLSMSPSGLSHSMKTLEDRLGVQLLSRTTRQVALTDAGVELLNTVGPHLEEINYRLECLGERRIKLAGKLRIAAYKDALQSVLRPALPRFAYLYPDIQLEVGMEPGLVDLTASDYDAGVTIGKQVAKEMTSVRVSPDIRIAVVASPAYVNARGEPRQLQELRSHQCINYRRRNGTLLGWDFQQGGKALQIRVEGRFTFNDADMIVSMAIAGHGLAYCFEHVVAEHIHSGKLISVLNDFCPEIDGYHLYHSHRRHVPPALSAFINVLVEGRESHGHHGYDLLNSNQRDR